MAKETLGRNITFPIYNENGTPFHNLALKKAVVDSVVMSLGDKITGDVYYKDNTLDVTMREYIIYKKNPENEKEDAVKYVLVNPPTIVREGLVSDNSELKGMTKYSFVFYHPMYILNNIPFTDVAVSTDEERYKSQDRSFSWIGYLNDYVNKLNKNLEGTEWIVVSNATDANTILSDVLTFDNDTIAAALKKAYETWGTPFIIDKIDEGEEHYSEGKRFSVLIGTPSNTITKDGNEYIFRFGQGLGLKNNSATPRNNKIITRIAGYGSEDNIPYGYPQIVWTGDSTWKYTINNTSGMQDVVVDGVTVQAMSYPIYDGIVGGQNVKLIKHPFTRTHLMPSVYVERVNKKVNPYAQEYNPDIEIIDYYDAVDEVGQEPYTNKINTSAPSYEIHQFSEIKPELGDAFLVADAIPVNSDQSEADFWDDSMDGDGNYNQSYFKIILPVLNFDLYACAAITQEMKIAMRGGACIGCTFTVQVNWESYKANFYDANGNFAPNGSQRNYEYFPDTTQNAIAIIVQKDLDTFGTIMPNVYQQPHAGDTFVFLGISLPLSYITSAQERLDNEMKTYMRENNIYYFDYPLKFGEYFLAKNTDILSQIRNNSAIKFQFAETINTLYVKQITIKYGNGTLPQYDITLTDKIEAEINRIGQMIDESVNRITTVQATFVDVPYTLTQSVRGKMSADWFQRLFVAYDANNKIVSPNDTQTEIARICALYDFYSLGGVSALGIGSSGGGGASLNALLVSLNSSQIGNTAPTLSENGKCPVWVQTTENDGHWEWGTTGSGGGGTVTSITAGTGLSGGTITTNGSIGISSEYQTRISHGQQAWQWGNHANAGYLTPTDIADMATKSWVENQGFVTSSGVTSVGLSVPTGFTVSGSPVTTSGTLSVGIASGYFMPTTAQRTTWNNKQDAISDLATIRSNASHGETAYGWGNHADAGYAKASDLSDYLPLSGGTLTGALHMGSTAGVSPFIYWGDGSYAYIGEDADDHITLRGDKGVNILTGSTYALSWNGDKLATQAWVEDQGFVTSSGVTSVGLSVPTGFTVSDSPVTTSGTLSVGIASGYFMPTTAQRTTWNNKQDAISDLATIRSNASHGETAYGWGNHANAGYLLRTEGMRFTDYGNYIAARFVNADGTYDATRAAKAQGEGYIEWWSSGGYFNHVMGFIRAKGNVEVGTSTSDTTHYLQIGGARIYWDNANNALKLIKADGTACNLYATGGVTALQTS